MSFVAFLTYLFCTFIRPQEWVRAVYAWPLIDITAIATLVCLFFEKMGSKQKLLARVPQNGLMIGLFISILMSHIAHTYFAGLTNAFNIFLVNFILFFVILNALNTEKKFKIAIWFMVFLIILMAIQGIYQLNHGYGWAGQEITKAKMESLNPEYRINWIGIFNDPNDLALTFVIAVGILLPFVLGKTKVILRLFSTFFLGLLSYGIFLTNSRGGFLALLATVFFYFVARTRKFILGGILGALAVIAILGFGPSRMALLNVQEESAYNRIDLWYGGMQMLKSNPLFGVGFRMFDEEMPQTAHNSFVLAGAELGFIGLFFFVGLIYASFKELSIMQKNDEKLRNYALGIQSALIGFISAAFFLSRTYTILPYMLFALSGALFFIARQRNKKLVFNFSGKDIRNTVVLSLGILAAVFVIIKIGL